MKKLGYSVFGMIIFIIICAGLLQAKSDSKITNREDLPERDVIYKWIEDEQAYSLSDPMGMIIGDCRIEIPTEFNGFPVIYIEDGTYGGTDGETMIIIPDSIVRIGAGAFSGCEDVKKIEIPASVTSIGTQAFVACSSLEEIIVDENNPIYHSTNNCLIDTEGKTLLLGCASSIIPDDGSVTVIGNAAFNYANIDDITIPSTITSIGKEVFTNTNLQSITISSSVVYIDDTAFLGVKPVINAPKDSYAAKWGIERAYKVNYIDDYYDGEPQDPINYDLAFALLDNDTYCVLSGISITSANVAIPERYQGKSVTSISTNAFMYNSNIESVKIPVSITYIGGGAFKNCSKLTSVEFSESITYIDTNAFFGCTSLKEVVLPKSLTYLANYAFNGCSGLEKVIILGEIESLHAGVFHSCKNLKEVELPSSITEIASYAFYGCPNDIVFYVDKDSYAETWAKEHGYSIEYRK